MHASVVLALTVILIQSPSARSAVNEEIADVVIAIETTDTQTPPGEIDSAFMAFFQKLARDIPISRDKMRVAVVQYSDDIHVLVPLEDGTSPDKIARVKLDKSKFSQSQMDRMSVAMSVREMVFDLKMGSLRRVPQIVIVIGRQGKSATETFEQWKSSASQKAKSIACGATADVVLLIRTYANGDRDTYEIYVHSSLFSSVGSQAEGGQFAVFQAAAEAVVNRSMEALRSCPYTEDKTSRCFANKNRQCVIGVAFKPEPSVQYKHKKYCPSDVERPCPNGDQGCKSQCEKAFNCTSNATKSCPKGDSPDDWTCGGGTGFTKAMMACMPAWSTILTTVLCVLLAMLITLCISRAIYTRRLDKEKRMRLELLNQRGAEATRDSPMPGGRGHATLTKETSVAMYDLESSSSSVVGRGQKSMVSSLSKRGWKKSFVGLSNAEEAKSSVAAWSVSQPPSLTNRTLDDMYRLPKKSLISSTAASSVSRKTATCPVGRSTRKRSPKMKPMIQSKPSQLMASKGYRP